MPEKPSKEIASNTGPFITLERLPGGFPLMKSLYQHIFIPPQVISELINGVQKYPNEQAYLKHYDIADFVMVETAPKPPQEVKYLEIGEQYAISLALHKNLPLLIEDRMARVEAKKQGLPISGIAGQILIAHDQKIIGRTEAQHFITVLYDIRRINRQLRDELLKELQK